MREVFITEACPTLGHAFLLAEGRSSDPRPILVIAFSGCYRHGSQGTSDAGYMAGVVALGCEVWEHQSLIIDLTQLSYRWGNDFGTGLGHPGEQPCVIVLGPQARAAESIGYRIDHQRVFEDIQAALMHLRQKN